MAITVFPWDEAERRARAGSRVRQVDWDSEWLVVEDDVWRIEGPAGAIRVVQSDDFGAGQFQARDWTTDPYADEDVCSRPPPTTTFRPPNLSLSAYLLTTPSDTLVIAAALGAGTYGGYRLIYFVNGQRVAVGAATTPGGYTRAIPADPGWLGGDISVEVRVESVLPLPPWSMVATAVISNCPIGSLHNPAVYMREYGFPASASGSLPKSVPGTSLTGVAVVQGEDYQLASDGSALYCDMPSYTGPGLPYSGYDGIQFHFAGVVRGDFDFSYQYLYTNNASFTGSKNIMCVSADPAAWDSPGLHIGSWTDKSWFPLTRLLLVASQAWHLHIKSEEDPPEMAGANLPTNYDTWHTRRVVKRGDTIEYSDGTVGPVRIRRCWLAVRGSIGLIISGGVRVKNLTLRAP